MKNKIISIFLIISIIVAVITPWKAVAAGETTHDYNELRVLDSEYSYATLFWTDGTEVVELEGNEGIKQETTAIKYDVYPGKKLNIRITKCAVDKDGNLCDVICQVDDVERFSDANNRENGGYATLSIIKYKSSELMAFWFNTVSASGNFIMQYVKTGTTTPANITKSVASIGDIDVPHDDKTGDLWLGSEGFTLSDAQGEVYYKKGNWLVDTENVKGVRAPSVSANINKGANDEENITPEGIHKVVNNDDLDLYNSAVVTEDLGANATFKLFYSGFGCGIIYVFASPYTFELDNPIKRASKTSVTAGEKFNYNITQYVPNNYYASELNFIEGINGKYSELEIKDTLNNNLTLDGNKDNIKVVDETNKTVDYFDVTVSNKTVTATAKQDALNNVNFYAHSYTVQIPVMASSSISGTNTASISNTATTKITTQDNKTQTKQAQVNVSVKYNVEFITNGGTDTPTKQSVNAGNKATDPQYKGTKTGYTFSGWSITDPDSTTPNSYDFDQKIYENKKLYAVWNPVKYNINYVLNDGTNDSSNPSTYTVEDTIDFKNPTREGYDFKGWYSDENFTTKKDGISNETGDVTVYAKWEAKKDIPYKVEHYKEGKNGEYELVVTDDLTGTTGEEATAVAKEYAGFKENTTYKDRKEKGTITADGSLVLKLYYDKEEYKVTYDTQGGTPKPSDETVKYQDKATEPKTEPKRDGYKFEYWYYVNDNDEEVRYNFDDPVTKDIELVARWEKVTAEADGKKDDPDPTIATVRLPQTGSSKTPIVIAVSIGLAITAAFGIAYYKMRDIK